MSEGLLSCLKYDRPCLLWLSVFIATILRMLFAIRRTGQNRPLRLAENTNRIALVDGDENAFIHDWIAIGIQKHEIGRAETATRQNNRGGIGNRGVGDFGVADDNLADGAVETKDTGVIHRDAQYVILSKGGLQRTR